MSIAAILGLARGPRLRAPERHEAASITTAIIHMPTPRLASIAGQDLAPLVQESIEDGRGILQMGLAPADLEIDGDRFAARCDLRLATTRTQLEIRIEGAIDPKGRVEPTTAVLLTTARAA